jgi:glucose/arabinose dehydrogenase
MLAPLPALWLAAVSGVGLPPGFAVEPVLGGLEQPVDLEFLPDGRLLVLERSGRIVISDPQATVPAASTYLALPSVSVGLFRGALGLTLDPAFEPAGFVYVYYCHGGTERFRVSRFAHVGDVGNPYSETVVWEAGSAWSSPGQSHFGGGIDFGPDGMLYLTVGLRNPFRAAWDLPTGRLLIGEVGHAGNSWEDVHLGAAGQSVRRRAGRTG